MSNTDTQDEYLLPDYQEASRKVELARIARKRKLAESLMDQMPESVRVGSAVAAPHWTSFLASGINQGLGRTTQQEADQMEQALLSRLREEDRAKAAQAASFLSGLPAVEGAARPGAADLANPYTAASARKAVELLINEPYEGRKREEELGKETRENAEWNRRNAITSGQALERAKAIGGKPPQAPQGYTWTGTPGESDLRPISGGPASPEQSTTAKNITLGKQRVAGILPRVDAALADFSLTPEKVASLQSLQGELAVAWKELANLGAPQAGDLKLMHDAIGNLLSTQGIAMGVWSSATGEDFTKPARIKLREVAKSAGIELPAFSARDRGQTGQGQSLSFSARDREQTAPAPKANRGAGDGSKGDPFIVNTTREASFLPKGSYFKAPNGQVYQRK